MLIYSWLVAILLVGLSFISLEGYAQFLKKLCKIESDWISRVLSVGFFSSLLGLIGLYSYTSLSAGFFYAIGALFYVMKYHVKRKKSYSAKSCNCLTKHDLIWLALPCVYFLTRFFSAGLPQQHNDALYYHLAGPKSWVEAGRIFLDSNRASLAQATLWENLYSLPMFFLGTKGSFSHVTTQLFGQWMHFFVGQVGATVILHQILKVWLPSMKQNRGFTFFLAWIVTTIPCIEWTGGLAKNDYIVTLFTFTTVLVLLTKIDKFKKVALCGVFAGFAFAEKMSAVSLLVCVPLLYFMSEDFSHATKLSMRYFLFATLAGIAVYMRNILLTLNPVFPMFDDLIGPHWIASWWRDHNASFIGLFKPDPAMFGWLWTKLLEKNLSKSMFIVAIVGILFKIYKARMDQLKGTLNFTLFFLMQLAFVMMILRPAADGRYAGAALSLILAFGFSSLIPQLISYRKQFLYTLLPLGLFINSPVDILFKIPKNYLFKPTQEYVDTFHAYQESKNWMNENVVVTDTNESVVIAIADKANFYLDLPYETFAESVKWQKIWSESRNVADFIAKCREQGYRYIFIQRHFVYPPEFSGKNWDEWMAAASHYSVFESQSVVVMDLNREFLDD